MKWIKNQLTDRSQNKIIEEESSSTRCVSTGVLRGLVLDPTLFNIFNDLEENKNHY